jgi:hypothetical protein
VVVQWGRHEGVVREAVLRLPAVLEVGALLAARLLLLWVVVLSEVVL